MHAPARFPLTRSAIVPPKPIRAAFFVTSDVLAWLRFGRCILAAKTAPFIVSRLTVTAGILSVITSVTMHSISCWNAFSLERIFNFVTRDDRVAVISPELADGPADPADATDAPPIAPSVPLVGRCNNVLCLRLHDRQPATGHCAARWVEERRQFKQRFFFRISNFLNCFKLGNSVSLSDACHFSAVTLSNFSLNMYTNRSSQASALLFSALSAPMCRDTPSQILLKSDRPNMRIHYCSPIPRARLDPQFALARPSILDCTRPTARSRTPILTSQPHSVVEWSPCRCSPLPNCRSGSKDQCYEKMPTRFGTVILAVRLLSARAALTFLYAYYLQKTLKFPLSVRSRVVILCVFLFGYYNKYIINILLLTNWTYALVGAGSLVYVLSERTTTPSRSSSLMVVSTSGRES
ncbi:hypothetical protein PUN28_008299 [Cardiocondyla obscurior]|uniref:Uncharacterized protein n=1 Tax=Cardiocondyla obscurior TaxID=286306 RepID=A0AAW2FWX2_9HYME